MSFINIEAELSLAIGAVGGQRVAEVLGLKNASENADFMFREEAVIAELKVLSEDQIAKEPFAEKMSALYHKYVARGEVPPPPPGKSWFNTESVPESLRREIADLYAVPVYRRIRKANSQTGETAAQLGGEWKGLLIIANDNNTAMNPYGLRWTLGECFRNEDLPFIDHVVAFTANLPTRTPVTQEPALFWYSARTGSGKKDLRAFAEQLRDAWMAHMASKFGLTRQYEADDGILEGMKNIPGKIK